MRTMREYHFNTLKSLLADIPAYVAILWIKFSGLLTQINLPDWEQWFWVHGWLILLVLRIANICYDMYLKIQYEDVINQQTPKINTDGFFIKLIKKLRKLIP